MSLQTLRHHVSGAIARGEAEPVVEIPTRELVLERKLQTALSALEFVSKWELMRANGNSKFESPLPSQLSNAVRKAIAEIKA